MLYDLIRNLLYLLAIALIIILAIKGKFRNKKAILITISIVTFVVLSFILNYPVENFFIKFATPEEVFHYRTVGEIKKVVAGENSAMIIYKDKERDIKPSFVTKDGDGWKIGDYSVDQTLSYTDSDYYIFIYNIKNTSDYYVTINEVTDSDIATILDSNGSEFDYISEPITFRDAKDVFYYTYVQNIKDDYKLRIDGQVISFTDLLE